MAFLSIFQKTGNQALFYRSPLLYSKIAFLTILLLDSAALAGDWQADMSIRILSPRTQEGSFHGKFYQSGLKVRIEPRGSKEVNLYDFEHRLLIRIFPEDKIYFKSPLSLAKIIKASKEGWISPPAPYEESKILLRKGIFKEIEGRLYLMVLESEGKRAYSLRWVTDDQAEHPLRVIYPAPADQTVIVDYAPITETKIAPDFFEPPADFLSLNPF